MAGACRAQQLVEEERITFRPANTGLDRIGGQFRIVRSKLMRLIVRKRREIDRRDGTAARAGAP